MQDTDDYTIEELMQMAGPPRATRPAPAQAQPEPDYSDDELMAIANGGDPGISDLGLGITGDDTPEQMAAKGGLWMGGDDTLGTETNPIDLRNLTPDQLPILKKGAWVQHGDERWALPGDGYMGSAANPERAAPGVYIDRPSASRTAEAFATAASEQIPGADEAVAFLGAKLRGDSYEDVRRQQMLTRGLLNQTNGTARDIGGVVGAVAPAALLPGAGWIKGAQGLGAVGRAATVGAGYGGAYGFGNTDGDFRDRATGAVIGLGAGVVSGGVLQHFAGNLAQSGVRAAANPSPQRVLSDAGVDLTYGQMAGGTLQRLEDGLTSSPWMGDQIRDAQRRGLGSYNRAIIDGELEAIGQKLPKGVTGREAYRYADDAVSNAYENAVSGVTADPSQGFAQGVAATRSGRRLPSEFQGQVSSLVDDAEARFAHPMSGRELKQLESEISAAMRAAEAGSATRPGQRIVADRLEPLRQGIRDSFEAADPFAALDKARADRASAGMMRVREAQQSLGTARNDGLFTPADYSRAVRAGDSSAGNRQFARGEALGQALSDAGQSVLPSTVPDSGTALRSAITSLGGLGALGGGGAAAGQGWLAPTAAATAGLFGTGAAAYSRLALALANAAYRSHSPGSGRQALAGLFGRSAPGSAALEQGVLQWLLSRSRDERAPLPVR